MSNDLTNAMRRTHLIDDRQKAAVDATLEDMGVAHKPRIVMYNKVDALSEVSKRETASITHVSTVLFVPVWILSPFLPLLTRAPQPHTPRHTQQQEEAAVWSEEVVQLMLEQEDAAKAKAAGPSTLGAQDGEGEEGDEDDEEKFMELAVAGSGMTGEGTCVCVLMDEGVGVGVAQGCILKLTT